MTSGTPATAERPLVRLGPGAVVLGIESSCDETGAGLVRLTDSGPELLGHEIASSSAEHVRFGGVVPEIASRAHLESMTGTVRSAFGKAGIGYGQIDAIAVTSGPGLAGALLVGVAAAKAYAAAWQVPLFGVNHLAGHVAADTLEHGLLPRPVLALLVSGGHTQILRIEDLAGSTPGSIWGSIREVGTTVDDAAGEAYDKVARLLGLGYPGGPVIDRLAAAGDPAAIRFPRGLTGPKDAFYDFSFSGLKTAVARFVEGIERTGGTVPVEDVCASFQEAVADVLTAKTVRAARDLGIGTVVIAGGVAANGRLRSLALRRCEEAGITLRIPSPGLCTDNGAMIAAVGAHLVASGARPSGPHLTGNPAMPVEMVLAH